MATVKVVGQLVLNLISIGFLKAFFFWDSFFASLAGKVKHRCPCTDTASNKSTQFNLNATTDPSYLLRGRLCLDADEHSGG